MCKASLLLSAVYAKSFFFLVRYSCSAVKSSQGASLPAKMEDLVTVVTPCDRAPPACMCLHDVPSLRSVLGAALFRSPPQYTCTFTALGSWCCDVFKVRVRVSHFEASSCECHVEAGEITTWGQEKSPRGGRRGCHVEAGEGSTWRH